jgi:GNAT superfamily N-acetyltransferase
MEQLTLRDGSQVLVRPVRPEDKALLKEGFARLGPDSRYQRFLSPVARLSDTMMRYLTEVDHHDHEALAAIDPETAEGIGVARFVRLHERPDTAEAAVTVIDDWQGRGLGTTLLTLLADRAREEGIARFTALLLARNHEMLEVLEHLWPVRVVDRQAGTLEIEAELPPAGVGEQLRSVLRASAAGSALLHPGVERAGNPHHRDAKGRMTVDPSTRTVETG